MAKPDPIREQMHELLSGGQAHLGFEDAVQEYSVKLRGQRPAGLPYSGWELLEHMRIAQHDILEFIRDPDYESPIWPEGYWPTSPTPPSVRAWSQSVKSFLADRKALLDMCDDPHHQLHTRIPHGTGQTLFRELLLVADHTAYHLGQLVAVRRLLGDWRD